MKNWKIIMFACCLMTGSALSVNAHGFGFVFSTLAKAAKTSTKVVVKPAAKKIKVRNETDEGKLFVDITKDIVSNANSVTSTQNDEDKRSK